MNSKVKFLMALAGEWQVVRRRRRFPDNWRTPSDVQLNKVRPYRPYSSKLTFAQVVARIVPTGSNSTSSTNSLKTSPASSRPVSPHTPPGTQYFFSPHSPTMLRFPPQSSFPEWRGRCFRCCRLGHAQANCRNSWRCGKCWSDGHIASQWKTKMLNPAARPFRPAVHTYKPSKAEPGFEELLKGNCKSPPPILPDGRPKKVTVFLERDEEFFKEVDNLNRAVVMYCKNQALLKEVHQVVSIAVDTKLVREEEIRVAQLSDEKFLIHLPKGLAVETFVSALPGELWDQGFQFQQWSLLDDATVRMPRFKILLDLVGLPPPLWKEQTVINSISKLGLFLGSVAPEHDVDLSAYRVAIATDDLMNIPDSVGLVVGGLEYPVTIVPISWERGPIYTASDYPILPKRLTKSISKSTKEASPEYIPHCSQPTHRGEELVSCSRRVLMEICQGISREAIPPEILAVLHGRKGAGEVSIEALEDLVFGTGDQNYPIHPRVNETDQNAEVINAQTPTGTTIGHIESQQIFPTVSVRSTAMLKETKGKSILEAENQSVQGTMETVQKEVMHQNEKGGVFLVTREVQSQVASGETNNFQPATRGSGRGRAHLIQRDSHMGQRCYGRSTPIIQFTTSRHNRFRGLVGRGRGRVNMGREASQTSEMSFNRYKQRPARMPQNISNFGDATPKVALEADFIAGARERFKWTRGAQSIPVEIINENTAQEKAQGSKARGAISIEKKRKSLSPGKVTEGSQQPKRPMQQRNANPQLAQILLNPKGYFHVQVEKSQCSELAKGCGVSSEMVLQALAEDNTERKQKGPMEQYRMEEEEMINAQVNQDSGSEDDYETEEECC